uniref:EF-hand domain-containing protein n=1 Tax=Strigamia maritima TaxID=126957 RepID=T1JKC1_STRMM
MCANSPKLMDPNVKSSCVSRLSAKKLRSRFEIISIAGVPSSTSTDWYSGISFVFYRQVPISKLLQSIKKIIHRACAYPITQTSSIVHRSSGTRLQRGLQHMVLRLILKIVAMPSEYPVHHGYELQSDAEERYEKLFHKLDINSDGRIDIDDLTEALNQMGMAENVDHAKIFMEKSKGSMDVADFMNYMKEHERKLLLVFKKLDINKDGRLDISEIVKAFKKLGIALDNVEAKQILKRMDRDGTLEIDFDEWRDYLLFHSSTDLHDIMKSWRHATVLDIGENNLVPDDFTTEEMVTGMWWRHLLAGGIAGAVSRTCTAPLDRLKVFLQVHTKRQFKGIYTCLRHMLDEGGMKSLWRGNGVNVLKIAPESAIKFMAYEQMKQFIRGNRTREISIYERFLAGSIAGGISQTVIYPLEVLKTRLALRKTGQYKNIWDALTQIYSSEGIRSFYRGYLPNLLGIIPYAGIDLAIYETLKKVYLQQQKHETEPGILVLLACGTASSTCGQIASYPLALVRTRLQAQAVVASVKNSEATMTGLFRNIVQTEGLPGLYRGIAPNFLKVAPAVSISYVVYERSRQALGVTMT